MGEEGSRREAYVDETVRVWLGLARSQDVPTPTLPDHLVRRLLRLEEYEISHRDQWGCWEFGFSESFRDGSLLNPEIDRWLAAERRTLAGRGVPLEPLWPEAKPFAICLTHDVDLVSPASTPAQVWRSMRNSLERPRSGSAALKLVRFARPPVRLARAARAGLSLAPSTAQTLERCVAIELEAGVTASYFFTVVPDSHLSRYDCTYELDDRCVFRGDRCRIRDVIARLASDGFDVGLHGSYHSAREPGLLARQKQILEMATDLETRTTRQHFLHWDINTTPHLQSDAGFAADSTLGFNRNLGFRAGTSLPFHHFDASRDAALPLLQLPLIIQDGPLFNPVALELDVELGVRFVHHLLDVIAGAGGVATVSFHPNNLEHENFLNVFQSIIDYGIVHNAWFTSIAGVEQWWLERSARLAAT